MIEHRSPEQIPGGEAALPLCGDLDDFRAFDLCQLFSMTGATGILRLTAPGLRGEVFVDEGRIVGARARPNPRRLGRLLRQAEVIDERTLAAALEEQIAGSDRRLGELLRARGVLSDAALAQALERQAEAALTALLIVPAGRFAFSRETLPASFSRLTVDPQGLVLEALTRIDELRGGLRRA